MSILPFDRDDDGSRTPRVVAGLIVVNGLLFLASQLGRHRSIGWSYDFTPARYQAQTLLATLFLHTRFLHLVGNMYFMWLFGRRVAKAFGAWAFAGVCLLSGLGANAFYYVLHPTLPPMPGVGASGCISGILGCFLVLFPRANFDLRVYFGCILVKQISAHTRAAIGVSIGELTLLGLLDRAGRCSSVPFWAYWVGFVVGLLSGGAATFLIPQEKRLAMDPVVPTHDPALDALPAYALPARALPAHALPAYALPAWLVERAEPAVRHPTDAGKAGCASATGSRPRRMPKRGFIARARGRLFP